MSFKFINLLLVLLLCGCGNGTSNDDSCNADISNLPPVLASGNWYKPQAGISWQWQLSGEVNTDYDVIAYDIDLFDTDISLIDLLHSQGSMVICYFSAGSFEAWREDAVLFSAADLGNTLDGWEDEKWLDIRADNVLEIMQSRISLAVTKGCDAVEPDNVDGYANNSGFNLTYDDQLNFNAALATYAHQQGLGIGLKNDLDQVSVLVDYFDFAVNEQCFEYDECELLQPFIDSDKAVLNAEYHAQWVNNASARQSLCDTSNSLGLSTLILPLALDDSFRFSCDS